MCMRSLEPAHRVIFCHSRLQQPIEAAENRPRAEFQDVQRAAPDHYGHHERLRRPLLGGSPPAACLGKVSHLHRVGLLAVLSGLRGYRCILLYTMNNRLLCLNMVILEHIPSSSAAEPPCRWTQTVMTPLWPCIHIWFIHSAPAQRITTHSEYKAVCWKLSMS